MHLRFLLGLALHGGKGLLQNIGRRGAEVVFAFFVEIHRRGIQRDKRGGELDFAGLVAKIFGGGLFGGKFVFAHGFPQQRGVHFGGFRLRGGKECVHVAVKLDKRIGRLDFHPLAVLRVCLIGAVVFLDDGGNFELPAFFVK